MGSRDTALEAARVQRGVLRAMGPARRLEVAFEISQKARELAMAGILSRNPSLSRAEARHALLRRVLGKSLADDAWPPGKR